MTMSQTKQPRRRLTQKANGRQKAKTVSKETSASLAPALAFCSVVIAGLVGVFFAVRARARNADGAMAHGFSEPVQNHSAYDIEYPPAP